MRVAEVCVRFGAPGGAEAHVAALARELARRGHDVTVVTSDLRTEVPWQRGGPFEAPPEGVEVVRLPMRPRAWMRPIRMEGLREALGRAGADVYHAHSHRYHHLRTTAFAARRMGRPWVVTPHFHPLEEGMPLARRALARAADAFDARAVYRGAARVLTVTDLEQGHMAGLLRPGSALTIPNGIDLARWSQAADPRALRDAAGLDGDFVLYAGRLASNKGLAVLVEAWARVAGRHPGVDLVLAGQDWGEGEALRRLADARGVGKRVRFPGHLGDEAYRAAVQHCMAFVLPSQWEAFGISLLEAMAAGRPCVATAVGGVPEVARHGHEALLVPYGDPHALAGALDRVLAEPGLAQALGARGRARAQAYGWPAVAARVERELLAAVGS